MIIHDEVLGNKKNSLLLRTILAILLAIPILLVLFGLRISLGVQALLATGMQVFCGWPFYVAAWKGLKSFSINRDTLIALGIGAAYLFDFYMIWAMPRKGIYFETSSLLTTFIILGRLIEERLRYHCQKSMNKLLSMQPKRARIRQGERFIEIPIEEVSVGYQIFVQPGERIPVDGEIIEGATAIDESMLTGDNVAAEKRKGSFVMAGTINLHGNFSAVVQKVGKETVLGQMMQIVQEARETKTRMQEASDRVFFYLSPAVIVISLFTWVGFWLFENQAREGLIRAIAILVVACPSALLSSAMVAKVAIAKAARMGIIIRDTESIQKVDKIKRLIIDKAFTILDGVFRVAKVELDERYYPIVKTLYEQSTHPAKKGILEFLQSKSTISLRMLAFRSESEKGVSAYYDQRNYYSGSFSFLEEKGIRGEVFEQAHAQESGMLVGLGTEKLALGYFVLSNQIQSGSKETIRSLRKMGIETILISCDRVAALEQMAETLDVDFYEELNAPEQKAESVVNAKENGKIVAVIGNSLSDSSAFRAADVSFNIGWRRNIANENATVNLISSHIKGVAECIALAKYASKKMNQNLIFAFGYHALGISLAAFGLLSPIFAGAIMSLSGIVVVYNTFCLQKKNFIHLEK